MWHSIEDTASTCSYYNLITEHGDLLPSSDHISLLLYALGGHNIPDVLLKSALLPQRRWNVDGEIETTTSATFGLPDEIIRIFANEKILDKALIKGPGIVMNSLQDGLVGWSLHPPYESSIAEALTPDVKADLGIVALKLICFTCPPCYLGDTDWYVQRAPFSEKCTDMGHHQVGSLEGGNMARDRQDNKGIQGTAGAQSPAPGSSPVFLRKR